MPNVKNKYCNDMKEKILEILKDNKEWNSSLEYTAKELLNLFSVSQHRELLVAYEKQHYTPSEWALASKQCEKEIDDFLATNCG